MKLSRTAPIRIGHISQISTIVIDQPLPKALAEICTAGGVDIIIAAH
jgi:DeoR family glycerol-3-phosphate regulon repressor